MKHVELPRSLFFDGAKSLYESAHPKPLGGAIAKRSDHEVDEIYC
jgi:hypothetical protein